MIRSAKILEIPDILKLTKACAQHMERKGIFQWNEEYPSRKAFERDISRNELFVIKSVNTLVGCITITGYMDKEYIPINWLTPNENNIYIHRLAVDPEYEGKGYARILMNFAAKINTSQSDWIHLVKIKGIKNFMNNGDIKNWEMYISLNKVIILFTVMNSFYNPYYF